MDNNVNQGGLPCGGSMYDVYSMFEAYNEIVLAAMEVVLEQGPDALMYQINYDDVVLIKSAPAVYEKAIELGILTKEE